MARSAKYESRRPDSRSVPTVVRCAIYTRKSTTEGLDSDFSTLDAQREACEAYIASQRLEGWVAVQEQYDDGGFTGGNIDRPALSKLLADIRSGAVNCVVVYKVDRLSRSLLDFAKLMEVFDLHQVSFVSVTQQFNTATSMGRLVLNVLLSFAQFEREIISERTSDKMCAARRKGKQLGGPPILGYDLNRDRKRLVLNPEEVRIIKEVYHLYLEKKSMLEVAQELNRRGWTTKTHTTRSGKTREGHTFSKTDIQRILTNVAYIGLINHKGEIVKAEHPPIIERTVFDRAQELIYSNRHAGGKERRHKHIALLKKLLRCGNCGAAMGHTYAKKHKTKLYRYYLCTNKQKRGEDVCDTRPLPAQQVEDCVVDMIRQISRDPGLLDRALQQSLDLLNEEKQRLKDQRDQVGKEQRVVQERVNRLIAVIESSQKPSDAVLERLNAEETQLREINSRLEQIETRSADLEARTLDRGHLVDALSRFDLLWDSLVERERIVLMREIIERVTYVPDTEEVLLLLRFGAGL